MTEVFIEQPLTLPGSAKNMNIGCTNHLIEKPQLQKYKFSKTPQKLTNVNTGHVNICGFLEYLTLAKLKENNTKNITGLINNLTIGYYDNSLFIHSRNGVHIKNL